jgi:diadenosine tetraphosphate (Ap4A) HIT family hydrolase
MIPPDPAAPAERTPVTNPTAVKFGYPRTLVAETPAWLVLVRPQQPTFGSLVLVCKEPAKGFSQLSAAAFADLKTAVDGIEALLSAQVGYQKINYLMLMMVDLDVHFHVIPRYGGSGGMAATPLRTPAGRDSRTLRQTSP